MLEAGDGPSAQEATSTLEALANVFLAAGQRREPAARITLSEETAARPPAVLAIDAQGRIQAFDGEAERIWQRPAAAVLTTPIGDLLELPLVQAGVVPAIVRRHDGVTVPVLVSFHALRLGGELTMLLVVRPQASITPSLRGSELRYRNLVEQIPAVVFTAALDGGLYDIYVGPQIETLLGYTQEEWLASPVLWYERLHPDDRRLLDQEFARGCATGGPFRAECRFIARDGRAVWVHGEARLIKDPQGWPLFLQGVAFDISETKRAEEVIRASLREKELLLKEIHHRVKNNLQITSSLLRLQVNRVSDEGARQSLRESQDRIRSIALVHEMLYRSRDLSQVDFGHYVKTLLLQLFRSYSVDVRRITYQLDIQPVVFGIDTAVPCGLILNELVANALKHAFPDGRSGSLRIRLTRQGDLCQLTVGDDGAGMPARFDIGGTETLGLQLVRTLADQLDGRIELKSEKGTELTVVFPLSEARWAPISKGF